ncbi:three-Cys-motif partner protein TcmP [Methanolobus sp.]|uniref:three-Cys-motif partner protein TcmP n=1 Tax=Methanolobus sp. TaxID=1874737 RepID=UPI0025F6AED1|nr:three-Cys-motif partner protein TcmP [Methanolobus sp.]
MPLADDDPKKWIYKEHTEVKHEILRKYLEAWIKILGRYHNTVCFFDCFAGRGLYTNGELGSPLIIMRAVKDVIRKFDFLKHVELTFIEKNKNNHENLVKVIQDELNQDSSGYSGITIKNIINDEFADIADTIVQDCSHPSFYFIDPFGFSGIPFDSIKKILALPRTEVFINFMIEYVYRFLPSEGHARSIEELYGIPNVKALTEEEYEYLDLEAALLKIYRDQLHQGANVKFTFPFKVNSDGKLRTTYYLIHATNNFKGCEVMKNVMYNAGTKKQFGYLGPAEGQMAIGNFDNLESLQEYLADIFNGQSLTYEAVRMQTANDLPYVTGDYKTALLQLESKSKISIEGKGKRGGMSDSCMVHFTPVTIEDAAEEVKPLEVEDMEEHSQSSLFDF